jgi:hypothetical protein
MRNRKKRMFFSRRDDIEFIEQTVRSGERSRADGDVLF